MNGSGLAEVDAVRFRASRINQGAWLVLEDGRCRRVVATCFHEHHARAIAALMNGDAEGVGMFDLEATTDENPLQLEMA